MVFLSPRPTRWCESNARITITVTTNNGNATINNKSTTDNPIDYSINYTPNTDFFGQDTLEYQICDIDGECATAVVTINVTNTNDLPIAIDDNIQIDEDTSVNIEVLLNDDFGGDGPDSNAISISNLATYGNTTIDDNGTPNNPTDDSIDYTPNEDFFGEDTFEYQICDANGDCASAVVTINVANTNDLPI
ncbi:MAG: Ig-like domain-containing protein, partial [Planctomycetota bacterium]